MASSSFFDTTSNYGVGSTSPAFDSSKAWSNSFNPSQSWSDPSWYTSNKFDAGGGFSNEFYKQADTFGQNAFNGSSLTESKKGFPWEKVFTESAKFLQDYANKRNLYNGTSQLYGGDLKGQPDLIKQSGDLTFAYSAPPTVIQTPGKPGFGGVIGGILGTAAAAAFPALAPAVAGALPGLGSGIGSLF